MRNFQAAALFAVPALAAPIAASSESRPVTHSEIVNLPLAVGEDGFEIVSLRLDVHATDKPCDSSAVSINGNTLLRDGKTSGSGSLTLEDGQLITAEWHFTCDDPTQFLDMTILSFDGDKIPNVSFSTHLLYSPESKADGATVGQPQVNDVPSADLDASAMRELRHRELQAEIDRLEQLRAQAAALEAKIKDEHMLSGITEAAIEEFSTNSKDCKTSRCMWQVIKAKVKATASGLREKVLGSHKTADQFQTAVQAGDNVHEQPLTDGFVSQSAPSEHRPSSLNGQELKSSESSREALLSALLLALLAFSLFTFFSLLYTHRERIRTAVEERRAHCRTREERRAARQARKEAIRDFFRHLLRSLIDYDVEKRAAEEERRRALAERQAEEGRSQAQNEQNTSMEQELAGLRIAVAMVDDMVSGRQPPVQQEAQQQEPQPPPVPPRPSISGFVTYDDRLPTYEEQIHDSAVIADGFRFEPGWRAPEQRHLPVPERSSDRLGYNK
ncbi:hypothetical protein NLU13_4866 [Sarocladium strictum]|uniref:Uncharacterized protein n=1 Tax=Sarocladium strictum TaxID=5046 RepID=A0AA39L937_SARSR|nr:hypothetical protein NLU13_4866 [Sarocladium strictum]